MNHEQTEVRQMLELSNDFQEESDRAFAVLVAAYLDELLGELIAAAMKTDSDEVAKLLYRSGHGPLGSFSARINTAYCLGVVDDNQQRDLNLIRKVRNKFAHEISNISFERDDIASQCREMKGAKQGGQPTSAREQFGKTSLRLIVDIMVRIREAEELKAEIGSEDE
jgi:DNA-binding MltR family transcriptional regulator